jgi:hypothetical protein
MYEKCFTTKINNPILPNMDSLFQGNDSRASLFPKAFVGNLPIQHPNGFAAAPFKERGINEGLERLYHDN